MNKKEACKAAALAVARNCHDFSSSVYFDTWAGDLVVVHRGAVGHVLAGHKFLGMFYKDQDETHNARAIGKEMRAWHIETRGLNLGVRVREHL